MNDRSDIESLRREQAALTRFGRLHWVHWCIVGLSVCITLAAWWGARSIIDARNLNRFDRDATQVVGLITDRLKRYEDALLAGVAAVHSNGGEMSREQWRVFAEGLKLDQRYPGINGIGMIVPLAWDEREAFERQQADSYPDFSVFPAHDESEHLVIVYIEPQARNAPAVGLDIAFETHRREGAQKARSDASTQISGPIVLVQDETKTPGFLFYTPYYKHGSNEAENTATIPATAEEREARFAGLIYAPFIVNRLTEGLLAKSNRDLHISIADGPELIYNEHNSAQGKADPAPLYERTIDVPMYGRVWRFDIRSTLSFRAQAGVKQPVWILLGGLTIDLMLWVLFALLTRGNRQALSFAERATRVLRAKAAALEASNAELETFAYVVSHDLKTPLRGIADLTDFLEEDFADLDVSPAARATLSTHCQRMHTQVDRASDLIRGILAYSSIGFSDYQLEQVNTADLVTGVAELLGLDRQQLDMQGDFPCLRTDAQRLFQVFERLIDNAMKFHPDPEQLQVEVSVVEVNGGFRFTVRDNGSGIDPRFHERIFQAFKTLQSKDEIESAGVGLSIVQKSVRAVGGSISMSSIPGRGSRFSFDWPTVLDTSEDPTADGFWSEAA